MKKLIILIALVTTLFGLAEGDKVQEFDLKTLDGSKSYKMSNFKGDVVLLNIWASWCGGCKDEMPEFFKLQREYVSGFKIVTVSVDKKAKNSKKFLQSVEEELGYKTPFVSLYDPKKTVAKDCGVIAMPSSYLIDKEGVVKRVIIGSLNSDGIQELKKEIDKLK